MWPNGFMNGPFPGDFNDPNTFPPAGFPSFPTGSFLPQLQQSPPFGGTENSLFDYSQNQNEGAFTHNNINEAPMRSPMDASGTPFAITAPPPPPRSASIPLDARAAQLKAQLLKRRRPNAGASSGTPTNSASNSSPPKPKPAIEPVIGSTEQDLDTMISELSNAAPATNGASLKQTQPDSTAAQPETASIVQTQTPAQISGGDIASSASAKQNRDDKLDSDMSEGEILDDPVAVSPKTPFTRSSSQTQPSPFIFENVLASVTRRAQSVPKHKSPKSGASNTAATGHQKSPAVPSTNITRVSEQRHSPRQSQIAKLPTNEHHVHNKKDDETSIPDRLRSPPSDLSNGQVRSLGSVPDHLLANIPPILAQLLHNDTDLYDWLLITGYHDTEYRHRILDRRRKLAALDAQRAILIAEMTEAERPPPSLGMNLSMLASSPAQNEQKRSPLPSVTTRDFVTSNKRSFSEVQTPRRDSVSGKIQRLDDRRDDYLRSRDGDQNGWRADRDDRSNGRPQHRSVSRERRESPGRYGSDRRPSFDGDSRSYENGFRDQDYSRSSQGRNSLPIGSYRGRGRGGRGGNHQSYVPSHEKNGSGRSFRDGR